MSWVFDEDEQQFEDEDGDVLEESALLALISLLADKVGKRMVRLITADRSGEIDTRAQQKRASDEIRNAHRMMAALGAGGLRQLTEGQKAAADNKVRREETYWLRLTMSVNTVSDEEAQARAAQYGSASFASFQQSSVTAHRNAGYDEARRITEHGAATCDDCSSAAAEGWVAIENLRPIGDSQCGSNCRCSIDYRQSGEARGVAA